METLRFLNYVSIYIILKKCIICPIDRKGFMQSSYRDPGHNNVLDKSSLESSECIR